MKPQSALEVPVDVAATTQKHIREKGHIEEEGVVLWLGRPGLNRVTGIIVPAQLTSRLRFQVPLEERQKISRFLAGSGEIIVAQVHSHGEAAFHSLVDDREAIVRRVGGYSLVVPDFGARETILEDAALFQLATDGRWQQIPTHTIRLLEPGE
jgi:hypothetical protein